MINFQQLIDQDKQFKEFVSVVANGMILKNPDFRPLLQQLYVYYQQDMSAEESLKLLLAFMRIYEADKDEHDHQT